MSFTNVERSSAFSVTRELIDTAQIYSARGRLGPRSVGHTQAPCPESTARVERVHRDEAGRKLFHTDRRLGHWALMSVDAELRRSRSWPAIAGFGMFECGTAVVLPFRKGRECRLFD
jgi:hypothetical protein